MDLRETLKAAMDGQDGLDDANDITTPADGVDDANRAQGADGAEAGAEDAQDPSETSSDGRVRDEKGRFAPKTEGEEGAQAAAPAEQKSETAKPARVESPDETIRPPPSLPAAVKAKFANLDPDVRQAFVALEGSVQQAKAEWGKKGERLNRFDEILAPHVDRWRMNGLDEYSGIQSLLAAQSILDRDPVGGLVHVARSYGLTPAHLAQAFGLAQTSAPQNGGQPAPNDLMAALRPVIDPLAQQVQTLQQQLESSFAERQAAELNSLTQQISAFAASPEGMYFDNVADEVAARIQIMRAQGRPASIELVKEAYEGAIWSNPETRQIMLDQQAEQARAELARQEAERKKAADKAQRDRANQARRAGGSITGVPSPGAQPAPGPQGSVRDSIAAAMQEIGTL